MNRERNDKMSNFVLSCCSTADLTDEMHAQLDIPYVCFHYTMDSETYPDDLGKTMPIEEFYTRVKAGSMPTTSQVNVQQYLDFFTPYLDNGKDILHLTLSSGISGSYNSACVARDQLREKYPDRQIHTLDSTCASSGYGLLLYEADKLRKAGKSITEVHDWVEANKFSIHHWVCLSDLSHLKRGGRISATSAIAGTILNICPLINVNIDGKLIQRKKIRGKKQSIAEMLRLMETHAIGGADYNGSCFISNAADKESAEILRQGIKEKFQNIDGDVMIFNIGTVIGSHTGPGTIALFFTGDKRTE